MKEKRGSVTTGSLVQLIFGAKSILIKSCAFCETNTVSLPVATIGTIG